MPRWANLPKEAQYIIWKELFRNRVVGQPIKGLSPCADETVFTNLYLVSKTFAEKEEVLMAIRSVIKFMVTSVNQLHSIHNDENLGAGFLAGIRRLEFHRKINSEGAPGLRELEAMLPRLHSITVNYYLQWDIYLCYISLPRNSKLAQLIVMINKEQDYDWTIKDFKRVSSSAEEDLKNSSSENIRQAIRDLMEETDPAESELSKYFGRTIWGGFDEIDGGMTVGSTAKPEVLKTQIRRCVWFMSLLADALCQGSQVDIISKWGVSLIPHANAGGGPFTGQEVFFSSKEMNLLVPFCRTKWELTAPQYMPPCLKVHYPDLFKDYPLCPVHQFAAE